MTSSFQSFLMGGFECSMHRRVDGVRLDVLASSLHDRFARRDYAQLAEHGIAAVRDGVRWHRVERTAGRFEWSSVLPMLRAAHQTGVQVVWDLCHYGWPDDLDIWSPAFVRRFARFARAFATVVRNETGHGAVYCPVNEMSYWAWAGGEVGRMNPFGFGRGAELKRQLVRATIAAVDAIRAVDSAARFTVAEPLIHVVSGSGQRGDVEAADLYRRSQFEVHDMISGRLAPELGGRPDFLDLVGANFYSDNQWYLHGPTIPFGHHSYRPLSDMLRELWERYDRPVGSRKPAPKAARRTTGCTTSAARCARRCARASRSKASASTRSPIIPDGTTTGCAASGSCRCRAEGRALRLPTPPRRARHPAGALRRPSRSHARSAASRSFRCAERRTRRCSSAHALAR